MKKKLVLLFAFALCLGFSGLTYADQAQDMEKMKAEAMAKWQEYATPSDGHKALEQLVGDWDYTLKYWSSPGEPPETSTGENEIEWILGKRYLEMEVEGTSMGQKFKGLGLIGYDNAKKQYNSVWIDTMGTGMMIGTGSYDAETNTFTETGTFTDPLSGQQSFKGVTKFIDKDTFTYDMFISAPSGEEVKVMEITYKRDT
ncbi:MAG: DUF1579 domain-containing protein [Thermodesulfobacteriota bacterium]